VRLVVSKFVGLRVGCLVCSLDDGFRILLPSTIMTKYGMKNNNYTRAEIIYGNKD